MADEWSRDTYGLLLELKDRVNDIVDTGRDRSGVIFIDESIRILSSLQETPDEDQLELEEYYNCPISKEIMIDPVVLINGQTYERSYIENWLKDGNITCPVTRQVLLDTTLIPNKLMRELISNTFEIPEPGEVIEGIDLRQADKDRWDRLLEILSNISADISEKELAARELRVLTGNVPTFCDIFPQCESPVFRLLWPLLQVDRIEAHPYLHENLIVTLFNISNENEKLVGESPTATHLLSTSLVKGEINTRVKAAETLLKLTSLESCSQALGKLEAIPALIQLLMTGHPLAVKNATLTLHKLCSVKENMERTIRSGVLDALLLMIMDNVFLDDLLFFLVYLVQENPSTVKKIREFSGAVAHFFQILMYSDNEKVTKNCVAILHSICCHDKAQVAVIMRLEETTGALRRVVKSGTGEAVEKAKSIIQITRKKLRESIAIKLGDRARTM